MRDYLDITQPEIWSHKKGGVRFTWPNGNSVSIVFGAGSYTENHMLPFSTEADPEVMIMSKTVEIMITGGGEFHEWFMAKYDQQNPAGRIPVDEVPEVLERARRGDQS